MTSEAIYRFGTRTFHRAGTFQTLWFQPESGNSASSVSALHDLAEISKGPFEITARRRSFDFGRCLRFEQLLG